MLGRLCERDCDYVDGYACGRVDVHGMGGGTVRRDGHLYVHDFWGDDSCS
jgi:hypothetical protein